MYTPTLEARALVSRAFTYHAPFATHQTDRYEAIRGWGMDFATFLLTACPPSRELSLALTNLQQTVHWANAAIACNDKPPTTP